MHRIIHIWRRSFAAVLALGLSSCGLDKSTPSTSETWSLSEPSIVRMSGESVRFSVAEKNFKNLTVGDRIVFPAVEPGVTMQVHTTCRNQDIEFAELNFTSALRAEYPVFSLLPRDALFYSPSPLKQDLRCELHFHAVNSAGSTHDFAIVYISVDITAPANFVALLKNGEALAHADNTLLRIENANLPSYGVITPHGAKSAELRCEFQSADVTPDNDLTTMERFIPNMTTSPHPQRRNQLCRIFFRDADTIVNELTDFFVWTGDTPALNIERDTSKPTNVVTTAYRLTNSGDQLLTVSIARGAAQPLQFTDVSRQDGLDRWDRVDVASAITTDAKVIKGTPDEVRFVIPPNSSARVAVTVAFGIYPCTAWDVGYYLSQKFAGGLIANVLDGSIPLEQKPGEIPSLNIAAAIHLQFENRWIWSQIPLQATAPPALANGLEADFNCRFALATIPVTPGSPPATLAPSE